MLKSPELFLAGILVIVFILLLILLKKEYRLSLFILLLLTIVSDINELLRIAVNLVTVSYLVFSFMQKYGFNYKNYPRLPKQLTVFILLYIAAIFLSSVFSNVILNGFTQLSRVLAFFVIIYLIFTELNSEKSLEYLLTALVLACTVTSGIIIVNYLSDSAETFNIEANVLFRTRGIYSNVNAMGGIFTVSFLVILIAVFMGYFGKYKYIGYLLVFFNAAGLFFNNSRSAILSFLIGALVVLFLIRRKYFITILGSFTALVLIILLNEQLSTLFQFYFRFEQSVTGRDNLWNMSVRMFYDNWIFGLGPTGYKFQMYNYLPVMLGTWDERMVEQLFILTEFGQQHNFYLFILTELGLVGFLVVAYFLYHYFKIAFELFSSINNNYKFLGVLGISTGIAMLSRGFFEALNILTYGWVSGDLPFWITVLSMYTAKYVIPGAEAAKVKISEI